jgi:hypothetical protein
MSGFALVGLAIFAPMIVSGESVTAEPWVAALILYFPATLFMAWRLSDEDAPLWAYWAAILLIAPIIFEMLT